MDLGMGLNLGSSTYGHAIVPKCWIPAYGAIDRYAKVPNWTAPPGSTIEFEMNFAVDNGNRYQLVMSDSVSSQYWFGIENGRWRWDSAAWDAELDGSPINNNGVVAVYGQTYHLKLIARQTIRIGVLGNGFPNGSAWFMTGGLRNIVFTHSTDNSLSRDYVGTIKSVNEPTTLVFAETNDSSLNGTLEGFPGTPGTYRETTCHRHVVAVYANQYAEEYT